MKYWVVFRLQMPAYFHFDTIKVIKINGMWNLKKTIKVRNFKLKAEEYFPANCINGKTNAFKR